MMKKLIAFLLAAVMLLSLVACNAAPVETQPKETQGNTPVDTKPVETTVPVEELEYVELDWVVLLTGSFNDLDLIQAALDEYFLEKLNCKVNLIDDRNYWENMETRLYAGEEIDLVHILDLDYAGMASAGAFYALDDLWEYMPNVKAMYSDDVWRCMTIDGKVYGAPGLRDNAYLMGVTYNNTLGTALGYDMEEVTKNWNSYMDAAEFLLEAVKVRNEKFPEDADKPLASNAVDPVPYAYAFETLAGTMTESLAGCNVPGLEVDASKGLDTAFCFYETQAYKDFCVMQQKLIAAGVYHPEKGNYFVDANILLNGDWGYSWVDSDLYGNGQEIKLRVFEDALWTDAYSFTISTTAIPIGSENPERAAMVLDLLMTDPYLATLCRFGVEGTHWEKDENGEMQFIGNNSDSSAMGWLSWYGIWHPNLAITECPVAYSGPDNIMLEKLEEYVADSSVAKHTGFVFDSTNVANEMAACMNVIAEYKALEKGTYADSEDKVLEAIDEFVGKLKANGLDKIIAEVQAQIDAYNAAN